MSTQPLIATKTAAHPYANVLGVRVSPVDMSAAVAIADLCIASGRPGYICLTSVHGIMEAQADPAFRQILNYAVLNAPDGMPLCWIGRSQGYRAMDRVFGPDFMSALCRFSIPRGYRHYLYGGGPGVAMALQRTLQQRFPGLQIVGTYTPPFRELTAAEEHEFLRSIRQSRPDILWVGLSTPKQERFMAAYVERLQVPLLVGVGAAFDYHTGRIKDSPRWIKRAGLQWLHRLSQDPLRLGRRYLRTHPAFLWQIAIQRCNRLSKAHQGGA